MVSEHVAEKLRVRHVFDCFVKTRQVGCGCFAHVGNRQRKKPARKRESSRAFDRLDRFGGIFLPEDARIFFSAEIQLGKLRCFQFEQIERLAHEAALNQFVGDDSADTFNIECAARGEKFQSAGGLGRTTNVLAPPGYEFGIAANFSAANWTFPVNVFEKIERLGVARPFRPYNFDDGRNDFAGFFDHDGVADANVLALDLVFVVQGRARNGAATDKRRFEHGHWRENPRSSDLNFDVEQLRFDALGGVFVSDRPPR